MAGVENAGNNDHLLMCIIFLSNFVDTMRIHFFCFGSEKSGMRTEAGKLVINLREVFSISELSINGQIRDREVRVIDENGEQLGIMSSKEAQALADEKGLDLVKIAPTAKPPVCKIVDYGKFRYEQSRKEKEAKKKQKIVELKEIRLSPNIDTNDLNTKVNAAKKFLTRGDRVKVTLRFRGREMAHMNTSKHILDDFAEALAEVATVEKPAKVEGRTMHIVLSKK